MPIPIARLIEPDIGMSRRYFPVLGLGNLHAPAAFLGCGSRLLGSLSKVEP